MLLLHLRYTYAISSRHRFPLCCSHLEPKYQPISQPETPYVISSFQSSRLIIHGNAKQGNDLKVAPYSFLTVRELISKIAQWRELSASFQTLSESRARDHAVKWRQTWCSNSQNLFIAKVAWIGSGLKTFLE